MPDENNNGGGDGAEETETDGAQGGDGGSSSAAQAASGAGAQGGEGEETLSVEEARKLRSEAKNLRTRLKANEDELSKLKNAGLSEEEQRKAELGERDEKIGTLEKQNRALKVQVAASKVGIVDPEAAAALLDWDQVDDPDDPKSLERALKQLVEKRPWLRNANGGGADGGAGRQEQGGTGDMNALIRRAAGRA